MAGELFEQYARAYMKGDRKGVNAIHSAVGSEIREATQPATYCVFDYRTVMAEPDYKALRLIAEVLPHGSGINENWNLSAARSFLILSNSYQVMNENGMYVGWAPFTIKIPRDAVVRQMNDPDAIARDFILQFNGDRAEYLNRQYGLRSYLDELLHDAFGQLNMFRRF